MCHTLRFKYIGKLSPSAIATISNAIATSVLIHLLNLEYLRKKPSATASMMKSIATAPLATTFVTSPALSAAKPLKVPATTSAKAATTSIQNSQQNNRNNFFPNLPMYSSMM